MELAITLFILALLLVLGAQLFLVIGILSLTMFFYWGDVEYFSLIKTMFDSVNKSALLSIPLYVFAGAVMSKGEIAKRLIDLTMASLGWLKGGLAIGAVIACTFFAAISGSSPVTLIAIGTIMYPAMIKHGYPEKMSLGVLTVSGSLGILIPPSIPMIIFAIVTGADVNKLFIAGVIYCRIQISIIKKYSGFIDAIVGIGWYLQRHIQCHRSCGGRFGVCYCDRVVLFQANEIE
jgi:C4-dicarboxylate transporter, DctM subunit